jgi:hypothetical protein
MTKWSGVQRVVEGGDTPSDTTIQIHAIYLAPKSVTPLRDTKSVVKIKPLTDDFTNLTELLAATIATDADGMIQNEDDELLAADTADKV